MGPFGAYVTGLAMAVSVPFSIGAAVFIGEFARGKTREYLKVLIEQMREQIQNVE